MHVYTYTMCVFIHIETHIHNKERRDSEFEREWKGRGRIWGRRRDENDVNLVHTHGISNKTIKKKDLC